MIDSKKLILSLEIEEHKIGAKALTKGLQGFCELIKICSHESNEAEALDIQVEALRPGSFQISLDLIGKVGQIASAIGGVPQIVNFLSGTITIITGYLELARFLKGKPADRVEERNDGVIVSKGTQNVYVNSHIYNLYVSNPSAANACRKAMLGFKDDERINGIALLEENGKVIIRLSRAEMKAMGRKNAYISNSERICTEDNATMILRGAGFDGTIKWKFLYRGQYVNVSIVDTNFIEKVKNGMVRLGNQDVFHARLEFTEYLDSDGWQAKDFKILKVYDIEVNPGPEQEKLFS